MTNLIFYILQGLSNANSKRINNPLLVQLFNKDAIQFTRTEIPPLQKPASLNDPRKIPESVPLPALRPQIRPEIPPQPQPSSLNDQRNSMIPKNSPSPAIRQQSRPELGGQMVTLPQPSPSPVMTFQEVALTPAPTQETPRSELFKSLLAKKKAKEAKLKSILSEPKPIMKSVPPPQLPGPAITFEEELH